MNVRRPTAADAAAVTELIQAFDVATTGESEVAEADVLRDWAPIDLDRDAWLLELDGALAGYCELTDRADELLVSGYVHPGFFARGVGTRIAELTEANAAARGAPVLRNAVLADDKAAHALLEGHGYRPVRHFYRMVIELTEPPPAPEWPAGVEVSTFDYRAEARAFHAALEETFAEEWDHKPETFEEWHERRIVRMPFDPSLWFVVRAGGEIAAVVACDWKRVRQGLHRRNRGAEAVAPPRPRARSPPPRVR